MQRVTIETVCQKSGLSRGTVSRALNNRADINQQTRQRVIEICKQLNYKPNHSARSLATGRSAAVAVITRDLQSAYTIEFLRGVLAAAGQAEFSVSLLELSDNPKIVNEQIAGLEMLPLDGLIFVESLPAPIAALGSESRGPRPVVAGGVIPGLECDLRRPDHREAGRLAARILAAGGARRAQFVYRGDDAGAAERAAGFDELRAENENFQITALAADTDLSNWLNDMADCEGFAAGTDALALQLMLGLAQHGRKVGEGTAVLGYGNEAWAARVSPDLSTIDPGAFEIGKWAFQTVQARASEQKTGKPQTAWHPPEPVLRSTDKIVKSLSY